MSDFLRGVFDAFSYVAPKLGTNFLEGSIKAREQQTKLAKEQRKNTLELEQYKLEQNQPSILEGGIEQRTDTGKELFPTALNPQTLGKIAPQLGVGAGAVLGESFDTDKIDIQDTYENLNKMGLTGSEALSSIKSKQTAIKTSQTAKKTSEEKSELFGRVFRVSDTIQEAQKTVDELNSTNDDPLVEYIFSYNNKTGKYDIFLKENNDRFDELINEDKSNLKDKYIDEDNKITDPKITKIAANLGIIEEQDDIKINRLTKQDQEKLDRLFEAIAIADDNKLFELFIRKRYSPDKVESINKAESNISNIEDKIMFRINLGYRNG